MTDWYKENIEEPLQDIVKYLRDNGINTECSCGHEMYIQCQYSPDGEFKRLHDLVYNYLHGKGVAINYTIVLTHEVRDGHCYTSLDLKFPSAEGFAKVTAERGA